MSRFNFRLGWFRIELLPKFKVVFDVRRRVGKGGSLAAIGAMAAGSILNAIADSATELELVDEDRDLGKELIEILREQLLQFDEIACKVKLSNGTHRILARYRELTNSSDSERGPDFQDLLMKAIEKLDKFLGKFNLEADGDFIRISRKRKG